MPACTVGMVRASEDRPGKSGLQLHPPGLAQWANRARAMATRINPSRPSIRPHSQSFWQTHLFCGLLSRCLSQLMERPPLIAVGFRELGT
jgi:hypothetical protein